MVCVTSKDEVVKQSGETIVYAIDFTSVLRSTETISTVSSILEVSTGDLTISNKEILTVDTTVDEVIIAAYKGVQLRVSGGLHGKDYRIEAKVLTSLANTRIGEVILKIRDR